MKRDIERRVFLDQIHRAGFKPDRWGNYKKTKNGKEYRIKIQPLVGRIEVKSGADWVRVFSVHWARFGREVSGLQRWLDGTFGRTK